MPEEVRIECELSCNTLSTECMHCAFVSTCTENAIKYIQECIENE